MRVKHAGKQLVRVEHTDLETGEITYGQERYVDRSFSHHKGFLYKARENYVKRFTDSALPEGLSWVDQGKLARLQSYIVGSSQLLGERRHGKFVPLTVSDMAVIFKCKRRSAYYTIEAAKKYRVVKEVKIGDETWFAYNPLYGLKNKRISLETFIIFQDELSEALPEWVKRNFLEQAKGQPDLPIVVH